MTISNKSCCWTRLESRFMEVSENLAEADTFASPPLPGDEKCKIDDLAWRDAFLLPINKAINLTA